MTLWRQFIEFSEALGWGGMALYTAIIAIDSFGVGLVVGGLLL